MFLARLVSACTVAAVLVAASLLPDPRTAAETGLLASESPARAGADGRNAAFRGAGASDRGDSVPVVLPTPQRIARIGPDVRLPHRVRVVDGEHTDSAARELLLDVLERHGVTAIDADGTDADGTDADHPRTRATVRLGASDRHDIAEGLGHVQVPDADEAYALRAGRQRGPGERGPGERGTVEVAIGGTDAAGQYYGVRTFEQLITGGARSARFGSAARIASVAVSDYPAMPLRGTIEGFYGSPWTHDERMDQLAFYGQVKANTYVYAPKDDPYHRDRWREPYPRDKLRQLGELVEQAKDHHVRFTFALSPGTSICYADPDDRDALSAKLQAMYDLGVRSFSIPLDDIDYTSWNCAADRERYGAPGPEAAARAQVDLLNDVQAGFVAEKGDVRPLQMVPTEYGDLDDSAYKRFFRANLHPDIEVMWTGTAVVPPRITIDQAERISRLYGRDVFVWDNYPVNDFAQTAGRLLLAPYDHRESGLSDHVSGLVSNPMNQAAASKVAVGTMMDFAWNDRAYDRDRSWRVMATRIAGGDPAGTRALLVFFDLNHLAPTFGPDPWQPQAPELDARVTRFWQRYDGGSGAALRDLERYLRRIERAPRVIRAVVPDQAFLSDAANWLDATELWGRAALEAVDVLRAMRRGDAAGAERARERMEDLAERAGAIQSPPGENRVEGPVRIGDGVLDAFLSEVGDRHDVWSR